MKVIALIPARYDASRFPGKLLQDLAGKPVIVRTYEATLQTNLFDEVFVVTDSRSIAESISGYGGKYIFSSRQHATGSDRIAEAAEQIEADIVINVQGDEPFVNKAVLSSLIDVLSQDTARQIDVASLVFPIDQPEAIANPNNVKVVMDKQDFALYFSRAPIPYPAAETKLQYYQHIGIYAFRKRALQAFAGLPADDLELTEKLENLRFLYHGMRVKMLKTNHKSIGIDTPEDLVKAIAKYKKEKL